MKILYATDMDRTMIFSHRFITEYPPVGSYSIAEVNSSGKVISYISDKVEDRLQELKDNSNVMIVPVTTRSMEEYNRINLGFIPKYAITSNGGTVLENGKLMQEWEDYLKDKIDKLELMSCGMDLEDLESVDRDSKVIDGKYVFTKTRDIKKFDEEISMLIIKYTNLNIVRQKDKVYAIPKSFSKAIALRWLQLRFGCDTLVASGDSELDLPMLTIADYAIIPEHGDLVKCGYVTGGRIAKAGIDSPLYTFDTIEQLLEKNHSH